MDPISALSLAVNVVAMVDTAVKTGKTLRDLYKSTSGFTKQTQELIQAMSQFEKALTVLDGAQNQLATVQSPGTDNATATAAKQCGQTIQAIKAILDQCRVAKPSSARAVVKGWFQSTIKHRSKIEALQSNLESATGQLRTSLAIATRTDVARMTQLLDVSDRRQAQLATKLQTITEELPKLDENAKLLAMIKETIILSEDSLSAMNHSAILRTLRPATADKRFEEINDPVANTFAWLLEESEDLNGVQSEASSVVENPPNPEVSWRLVKWLKAGSGVFHIAGKPGCGKSTLMKYLAAHDTTRGFLQQWASTDGKQLIFSGFFFWKLGTDEQKTMRGLLRGVLYDALRENPGVAKLVFPEHWAPKQYASQFMAHTPGPSISDAQVKTAFDRLLNCEEIFDHFKICLFIDGLDEFDESTQSLWAFSEKLNNWTKCDNVKLCVSSREETPILRAFPSAQRITLHTLTSSDVEVLVCTKLESNPHFQTLAQSDSTRKCRILQSSIIENAEGVFLWVVLLLKWMEEELATGAASFQGLQRLVDTAPRELDSFFARILESIPKHHSRGAYFILAMMLRVRGYCISRECSFDLGIDDDDICEPSLIGLSYIFDAFDSCRPGDRDSHIAFPVPQCAHRSEYDSRQLRTVARLQSWCKGLAEARESRGLRIAMFTHRSVPDFLSRELQDIAPKWNMDDNWVAEGILTICLAEAKAHYITEHPGQYMITERLGVTMESIARPILLLPAPSTSRIFTLLDKIDATRQGLRHGAPEGIGTGYPPGLSIDTHRYTYNITHGALSPTFVVATTGAVPLISYIMWKLENPQVLNNPLNQLLMLTAVAERRVRHQAQYNFVDLSPIVKAVLASGISPNVKYPQFPQFPLKSFQNFNFTQWLEYPTSGRNDEVIKLKSPWRDILSIFISAIVYFDKSTVPDSIWNELRVWLQFGAEVPVEVLVVTSNYNSAAGFGFRYPTEKAEVAISYFPVHRNLDYAWRMKYFRTFKSTTLSSMIRWHNPQNMEVLLKYTDLVSSSAEDPQEWKPPPYAACSFDEEDNYLRNLRLPNTARNLLTSSINPWISGLTWRTDLHEWVLEDNNKGEND